MNRLVPFVILTLAVVYFYWYSDGFDAGSIRGKRVFITGASSGIGEQLAYEYSKLGAKVFITARRENLLEKVAQRCKELGAPQVEFVTSDLEKQKDRDRVVAEVQKRLGGLDHLILNHAIMTSGFWLGTKENMTKLMFDLQVNFVSFVDLASQCLPMLTESKGNIGVVSSVAGKFATAIFASYCADKHALQGFFSSLRQELLLRKIGVSVTTCVIGPVDTDLLKKTQEEKMEIIKQIFYGYNAFVTAQDTAVAVMTGVTQRKYEIYFGKLAGIMIAVHKVFPGYFEDFFGKSMLEMEDVRV